MALRKMLAALLTVAAFVLGAAGSAAADNGAAPFASQAREAGLTAAEARQLQGEVDSYLAKFAGEQVSANRIRFDGGEILVAVPGEKYARDLATTESAATAASCPYYHFCMYTGTSYSGTEFELYYCGEYALENWVDPGSYINNQSSGTLARIKDRDRDVLRYSYAYDYDAYYDWYPVWYVEPC